MLYAVCWRRLVLSISVCFLNEFEPIPFLPYPHCDGSTCDESLLPAAARKFLPPFVCRCTEAPCCSAEATSIARSSPSGHRRRHYNFGDLAAFDTYSRHLVTFTNVVVVSGHDLQQESEASWFRAAEHGADIGQKLRSWTGWFARRASCSCLLLCSR